MEKDFDKWNMQKKEIEVRGNFFNFDVREIWWVNIGENIGNEICGKNDNFERPVLILKKNDKNSAFVLPITSSIKKGLYYFKINIGNQDRNILLHQGRSISRKRMLRRIQTISENKFRDVFDNYLRYLEDENK